MNESIRSPVIGYVSSSIGGEEASELPKFLGEIAQRTSALTSFIEDFGGDVNSFDLLSGSYSRTRADRKRAEEEQILLNLLVQEISAEGKELGRYSLRNLKRYSSPKSIKKILESLYLNKKKKIPLAVARQVLEVLKEKGSILDENNQLKLAVGKRLEAGTTTAATGMKVVNDLSVVGGSIVAYKFNLLSKILVLLPKIPVVGGFFSLVGSKLSFPQILRVSTLSFPKATRFLAPAFAVAKNAIFQIIPNSVLGSSLAGTGGNVGAKVYLKTFNPTNSQEFIGEIPWFDPEDSLAGINTGFYLGSVGTSAQVFRSLGVPSYSFFNTPYALGSAFVPSLGYLRQGKIVSSEALISGFLAPAAGGGFGASKFFGENLLPDLITGVGVTATEVKLRELSGETLTPQETSALFTRELIFGTIGTDQTPKQSIPTVQRVKHETKQVKQQQRVKQEKKPKKTKAFVYERKAVVLDQGTQDQVNQFLSDSTEEMMKPYPEKKKLTEKLQTLLSQNKEIKNLADDLMYDLFYRRIAIIKGKKEGFGYLNISSQDTVKKETETKGRNGWFPFSRRKKETTIPTITKKQKRDLVGIPLPKISNSPKINLVLGFKPEENFLRVTDAPVSLVKIKRAGRPNWWPAFKPKENQKLNPGDEIIIAKGLLRITVPDLKEIAPIKRETEIKETTTPTTRTTKQKPVQTVDRLKYKTPEIEGNSKELSFEYADWFNEPNFNTPWSPEKIKDFVEKQGFLLASAKFHGAEGFEIPFSNKESRTERIKFYDNRGDYNNRTASINPKIEKFLKQKKQLGFQSVEQVEGNIKITTIDPGIEELSYVIIQQVTKDDRGRIVGYSESFGRSIQFFAPKNQVNHISELLVKNVFEFKNQNNFLTDPYDSNHVDLDGKTALSKFESNIKKTLRSIKKINYIKETQKFGDYFSEWLKESNSKNFWNQKKAEIKEEVEKQGFQIIFSSFDSNRREGFLGTNRLVKSSWDPNLESIDFKLLREVTGNELIPIQGEISIEKIDPGIKDVNLLIIRQRIINGMRFNHFGRCLGVFVPASHADSIAKKLTEQVFAFNDDGSDPYLKDKTFDDFASKIENILKNIKRTPEIEKVKNTDTESQLLQSLLKNYGKQNNYPGENQYKIIGVTSKETDISDKFTNEENPTFHDFYKDALAKLRAADKGEIIAKKIEIPGQNVSLLYLRKQDSENDSRDTALMALVNSSSSKADSILAQLEEHFSSPGIARPRIDKAFFDNLGRIPLEIILPDNHNYKSTINTALLKSFYNQETKKTNKDYVITGYKFHPGETGEGYQIDSLLSDPKELSGRLFYELEDNHYNGDILAGKINLEGTNGVLLFVRQTIKDEKGRRSGGARRIEVIVPKDKADLILGKLIEVFKFKEEIGSEGKALYKDPYPNKLGVFKNNVLKALETVVSSKQIPESTRLFEKDIDEAKIKRIVGRDKPLILDVGYHTGRDGEGYGTFTEISEMSEFFDKDLELTQATRNFISADFNTSLKETEGKALYQIYKIPGYQNLSLVHVRQKVFDSRKNEARSAFRNITVLVPNQKAKEIGLKLKNAFESGWKFPPNSIPTDPHSGISEMPYDLKVSIVEALK